MSVDAVAALVSALFGGSFAIVALGVALRNGALREDVARLDHERDEAAKAVLALQAELERERASTEEVLTRRREEVERLYDDLGSGDDHAVGLRARDGIRRLLATYGADR